MSDEKPYDSGVFYDNKGNAHQTRAEAHDATFGGGSNNVSTGGLIGIFLFFGMLALKITIYLIKKGIIPCLAIAAGCAAFITIPYGLITKTSFIGTATIAFYIVTGVFFIVSMIAWNKGILKILFSMGAVVLITLLYICLVNTDTIAAPDYMRITKKPAYLEGTNKVKGYRYRVNDEGDGIIIMNYTGLNKKIVIPTEIDGLPVVSIDGSLAVNMGDDVTSITFPDTVEYISGDILRMSSCKKLKQITLPKNLKYIGGGAFMRSGLTSLTIPEGVTDIGEYAFAECENLTEVHLLPKSIKRLGNGVFDNTPAYNNKKIQIEDGNKMQYGRYWDSKQPNTVFIEGMNMYFEALK
jgi:hypothetical protein